MKKTLEAKINEAIKPVIEQTQREPNRFRKDDTQALRNRLKAISEDYEKKTNHKLVVRPGQIWAFTDENGCIMLFIVEEVNHLQAQVGTLHNVDFRGKTLPVSLDEFNNKNWQLMLPFTDLADWFVDKVK